MASVLLYDCLVLESLVDIYKGAYPIDQLISGCATFKIYRLKTKVLPKLSLHFSRLLDSQLIWLKGYVKLCMFGTNAFDIQTKYTFKFREGVRRDSDCK